MSLVIDLIDLVAKHKSGELRCPATALIRSSLSPVVNEKSWGWSLTGFVQDQDT